MENFAKKVGYILSLGSALGLVSYLIYIMLPEIAPYVTRPAFLIIIAGLVGVLLIILGLILEKRKESNGKNRDHN